MLSKMLVSTSVLLLYMISVISCLSSETNSAVKLFVSNTTINDACMLLTISAQFTVQYKVNQKSYNVMGYLNETQFNVKNSAAIQVDGSCGSSSNEMRISWPAVSFNGNASSNWNLSIRIDQINSNSFKIMNTNLMIDVGTNYPGITNPVTWNLTGDIISREFGLKKYFICKQSLTTNFNYNDTKIVAKTLYMQFQGFRSKSNSGEYTGTVDECSIDLLERNIVPLIVGGVLTGMIIIVIITYLIGRHRHRANYQTI